MDLVARDPSAPHTLATLAAAANFSPYHFHRVFRSVAGESLGRFVQRHRIQRAALELRSRPKATLTDVAFAVGYQSLDGFRRAFQTVFGILPSQWDRSSPLRDRAIAQPGFEFPVYSVDDLARLAEENSWTVEEVSLPAMRLASCIVDDAYNNIDKVTSACERLIDWNRSDGADVAPESFYGISWDDPEITPLERCRFEWAVKLVGGLRRPLPEWLEPREQSVMRVARILLRGDLNAEDAIWQYLYRVWLPESGFEPAHSPAMEIYRTLPTETGWDHLDLYCALPIQRRDE
jgi:AraC family transcriptional regulator